MVATAVPLIHEKRVFLATAAHVAEPLRAKPERFGVAPHCRRATTDEILTLQASAAISRTNEYDFAVLELQTEKLRAFITDNYYPVSLSEVAEDDGSHESFLVAGFPAELGSISEDELSLTGQLFVWHGPRKQPPQDKSDIRVYPESHIFIGHSLVVKDDLGNFEDAVELPGVSGGGVWAVEREEGAVWSPDAVLRLCGFEMSAIRGEYIRGVRRNVVASLFDEFDLGNVLRRQ